MIEILIKIFVELLVEVWGLGLGLKFSLFLSLATSLTPMPTNAYSPTHNSLRETSKIIAVFYVPLSPEDLTCLCLRIRVFSGKEPIRGKTSKPIQRPQDWEIRK